MKRDSLQHLLIILIHFLSFPSVCWGGSMPKSSVPEFSALFHRFQLLLDPQMSKRHETLSQSLKQFLGLPFRRACLIHQYSSPWSRQGGILVRCLNHTHWLCSIYRSSIFIPAILHLKWSSVWQSLDGVKRKNLVQYDDCPCCPFLWPCSSFTRSQKIDIPLIKVSDKHLKQFQQEEIFLQYPLQQISKHMLIGLLQIYKTHTDWISILVRLLTNL